MTSMPSSSIRRMRAALYAPIASACRPHWYSAVMRSSVMRSRQG
jgi:hypothetical protein